MKNLVWRKSSRSGNNGGTCVEIALDRRSGTTGDASTDHHALIRDSTHLASGVLSVNPRELKAFLHVVSTAP